MHPPTLKTAVRRIRSLAGPPGGIADADLLARYRATRDDRAFAALVARHGPAVLGTCRRILADPHAADDAFQATFLVLARRAGAVRRPTALACWLHGVAVRVSLKLKGRLARRPRSVAAFEVAADPRDEVLWRDVRRVLDEEVNRLPERLRLPVYLCYFEGKTRDEAADALGWKVTTLRGRLEDGRLRLRTRLTLRGIELSAALLAVSAAADGLAVGDALVEATVRAAGGPASDVVRSLARGVVTSGAAAKAKWTAGAVLLALGLGTTLLVYRGGPGQAAGPGPGFKGPPTADKPQPPAELIARMQAADRVWVVDPPTDEKPVPEPVEVLKGLSPPDPRYSFRFNVEALKDLPRQGHRWVVFLKCVEETERQATVPLPGDQWFVPADDATLAALRGYVPPCQWGEASNGLRLGLYARPKADEPTVEVVLQNVGVKDLTVVQFAVPTFDDWPTLTFAVAGPGGKTWRLERTGRPYKDSPPPSHRLLKPGERYIHVVRPARWVTPPAGGHGGNAPAGLFAGGGDFQVEATYQLTDGRDPPRWWIGKLTAGPVTVSVPAPAAYGDPAGDFRIRLRPVDRLGVGETPGLVIDAKNAGKQKWTVDRRPENAEVEWDGKWYSPPARRSRGGLVLTELAPGAEFLPWETVRPDGAWVHERDKPGATGDPGEATKELIPFRLTPGKHAVRVAYWFGKDVRAVSNAITVEVAPDGWGKPAGGVRARLRLPKSKLKPGEPLAFELDLKNVGLKTWKWDADPFACFVYADDLPYAYSGPIDRKGNLKELKPGGELVPFVTAMVDTLWQTTRTRPEGPVDEIPLPQAVPFHLAPGKHTVRVAFPLEDRKLLAVSNAVEIEVEAPKLDLGTELVAELADRIWIVPSPTREKPVPSPIGVLKGPPSDAGRGGLFDLRLLPGDDPNAKWIVFLAADDGRPVPEVKVWPYSPWSRPYTPELADAIRRAFLPAEWGPEKDGLRLGLRLRETNPKAGEPVAAEVTIRNVGTRPREIQQLRYNIYDYWPQLRFEVTAPGGSQWVLEKPDGPIKEADAPTRITLKPGETYTQAMRLDRWPARPMVPKDGTTVPNVFSKAGEYTVTCRHALTFPLNEATWTAGLGSAAAKLTLRDPAKEPAWGDAVNGLRARARLVKTKLAAGEPLTFDLDLKNDATEVRRVKGGAHRCAFLIDGQSFTCVGPPDRGRMFGGGFPPADDDPVKDMLPGREARPFLTVTPDDRWAHVPGLAVEHPFRVTAGKHTLVIQYQADDKTWVKTPPVEFEAADDYGDPVGGLAARLRMKTTFKPGETPAFELDLKNNADKTYVVPIDAGRCELHLDGVTYTREARPGAAASNTSMYLGTEFVPFLKGDLGGNWTVPTRTGDPAPLPLRPGKHRLKVAYPVAKDVKPLTKEVEFEVVTADEWGDPAGGVRARLRLTKTTFPAGGPFAFELDLKNTGDQTYEASPIPQHCRIEIDEQLPYTYIGPIDLGTPLQRIAPGDERVPWVQVTTDRNWAHAGYLYFPFKLTPGKHTARVSYPLSGKVTPVSQPVGFTVTADEWGEPSGGIRARVRLAKPMFKAGEPLAFEFDLKNTGDQTVEDGPIPMFCLIDLDGDQYQYTAPLGYPTAIQKLTPGKEFVPWVKVETNQWWTHLRGNQSVPLALTPGKHTLKVSYPLRGERKPTSPAVEFEVEDPARPPDLPALVAASDRVVVADLTRKSGVMHIEPRRVLKGPNQQWPPNAHPVVVPAGCDVMPGEVPDDPIPGSVVDVGSWILFLKAEEDGEGPAKLTPAVPHGWYRRATDKEIEAVLAALPKPAEAGPAKNGLALALRPRATTVRAGEEVRLEAVLSNTSKDTLRVLQQRYNVYDYWPFLTFNITLPNGTKLTVAKPEGAFSREDFIAEVTLKPGESYAHAVRLDRWPAMPKKQTEDLGLPAFAFAVPGTYKVEATYTAPAGFKNLRPGVATRDWPFWNGELTSNTITVEVKGPFDEVRLAAEPGSTPLLYVVLTQPKADVVALVVRHAAAALAEADRQKFSTGNVVFLIRDRAGDDTGRVSGFSREQLEEIRKAKPADARRLVERHAWSLGKLPDGK